MTPQEAIAKLRSLPEDQQRAVLQRLSPEDRKGIMQQLQEPASTDPSGRTPTGEPAAGDTRNGFQRLLDNMVTRDPRKEEWQSPTRNAIDTIARGSGEAILTPIAHPIQTLKGIGSAIAEAHGDPLQLGSALARPMIESAVRDYQESGPAYAAEHAVGNLLGGAAAGELGGTVLRTVPKIGSAIRTAAIGDPDVAALKGLGVGPKSPKSLRTVSAVEGSRPFLKGAKSLEDLQAKVPEAKNEIWGPYQNTVDAIGDKPVKGPDGMTTVRALEDERQQLSALNRKLKSNNPEAVQLAQQKGMTQAQLLEREKMVQSALDPHLEEAGVDPKLIRKTFGQVSQIGERVSGKSTLAEAKQPFGLSRLKDVSLTKPLSNIPLAGDIGRDIAAGRYFSAKPTDVAIREAFRMAGPKPDFRAPVSAMPTGMPAFRLPSETIANGEFGPPESRLLDSGIGHSQRTIAEPEILPPARKGIPMTSETPNGPIAPPAPHDLKIYPPGSQYRDLGVGLPEYPPASAFRPKAKPFDIDEYLKGQQ